MADVIVRGMELPESCFECILTTSFFRNLHCDKLKGMSGFVGPLPHENDRHPDCPLVPLPEGHGRLIDADALERVCKEIADCEWNKKAAPYSWEYAYNQFIDDEIFNAPTIVPAEGGGEDGDE